MTTQEPRQQHAISEDTRRRIEECLRTWNEPDSDARKRFETAQEEWDRIFQPLEEAITESERLTENDFAIRINARD